MTVLTGKTWLHSDFEFFPVNLWGKKKLYERKFNQISLKTQNNLKFLSMLIFTQGKVCKSQRIIKWMHKGMLWTKMWRGGKWIQENDRKLVLLMFRMDEVFVEKSKPSSSQHNAAKVTLEKFQRKAVMLNKICTEVCLWNRFPIWKIVPSL